MDEKLSKLISDKNLAEGMDEDELKKIGAEAFDGFTLDHQSRTHWESRLTEWTNLAKQLIEPKTWPWPKASNVKYPLLSTAAMQFAARAYPSLVPSNGKIVNAKPAGRDKTGQKTELAEAVSIYMSYQLLEEMEGWEADMDKLLIMLPVVGVMFKKTYWDALTEQNCSKLVLPKNLVVNYWAKTLKDAERISEILEYSARQVKERQQSGLWLDIELGQAPQPEGKEDMPATADSTTPYTIIEQHTFLDLDADGYKEPYIVTFHKETHRVLRIVARFDEDTIFLDDSGDIKRIEPIQYYTKFGFIPNPDGSFYDIGFGVLLGPLNESVNTLINQLVDAGSLANLQAGFIGKGLRIRAGETRFNLGEWKQVNSTGDDLRKQIVPLPSKEPSTVLFQLMGSLITSGKELASVAEIFVGKMPGQNTPATTTMASIEQGMKVFTAVYKRIYRSLSEEFKKIARLNRIYLNPASGNGIVDIPINPEDFDPKTHMVIPGADPTAISQTEKLMKAQGLMELLQTGVLDPVKVVMRVLDAQEQPNWQELIKQEIQQTGQMPPPPPDPKLQEIQMKSQAEQAKIGLQAQAQEHKQALEDRGQQVQLAMQQQEHAQNMQQTAQQAELQSAVELHKARAQMVASTMQTQQQMAQKEATHQQQMQHAEQAAKQQAKMPTKGATRK
jgi:chaperonin GroES